MVGGLQYQKVQLLITFEGCEAEVNWGALSQVPPLEG